MKTRLIAPGSTIGLLGGGQLGRMFTVAAKEMGYRVHVYTPERDAPASQLADFCSEADYLDMARVKEFAESVDLVTLEFENIPVKTAEWIEQSRALYPGSAVLSLTQNRIKEKEGCAKFGFDVTPFSAATTLEEALTAYSKLGPDAILKTSTLGYDGKGQARINSEADLRSAWSSLGEGEKILEKRITLAAELSVIIARRADGLYSILGPFENLHVNGILDLTVSPGNLDPKTIDSAIQITVELANSLNYVGVLCVEYFLSSDGKIYINELAPRPHNSGHLTIEAFSFSQYHQQLRAVCNLPLGEAKSLSPAAMVNLLGDLWVENQLNWEGLAKFPRAKLHLYGKLEARAGRKMGHITVLESSADKAKAYALAARSALKPL